MTVNKSWLAKSPWNVLEKYRTQRILKEKERLLSFHPDHRLSGFDDYIKYLDDADAEYQEFIKLLKGICGTKKLKRKELKRLSSLDVIYFKITKEYHEKV